MSPHRSAAVPISNPSQILAMPRYTLSPSVRALASILRRSISPPPVYTLNQLPSQLNSSTTYRLYCSTNRPPTPAHCCIHMHTVIATEFSCELNMLACTPTNSWSRVAELGWLGSLLSFSPVKKLPHPKAPSARPRETATTLIERIMSRSPRALAVQGDGEHERAALGVAEILRPLNRVRGPAAARLGVEARPFGPGVQVSARHPDVDAAEAEGALHPRRVQRVRERDLAQLDVAVVVEARLVVAGERAGSQVAIVPVLADRNRHSGPRAGDRPVVPATFAERPHAQRVIGVRHAAC